MTEELCTVARKPCCKRIVFACANARLDVGMRREIRKLAGRGCTIEHMPAEAVRDGDWGCQCFRKKQPVGKHYPKL